MTFCLRPAVAARASGLPAKLLPTATPAALRKNSRRLQESPWLRSRNGSLLIASSQELLLLRSRTVEPLRAACRDLPYAARATADKRSIALAPSPSARYARRPAPGDSAHPPSRSSLGEPARRAEWHPCTCADRNRGSRAANALRPALDHIQ